MEGRICRVYSATCIALEVVRIVIEVSISKGIGFYLVGLPDSAVREALLRVATALQRYGYALPGRKTVINLAPANIRKEGSGYDLAIAVAVLTASGQMSSASSENCLLLGELALDGSLRKVNGALPIALQAFRTGFVRMILPKESADEAAEAGDLEVYAVENLKDAIAVLNGNGRERFRVFPKRRRPEMPSATVDLSQVKGQFLARRSLEIAASGGHNLLFCGPPGSGKSMLAKSLPSLLPPMSREEALETSMIYSVSGLLQPGGLMYRRPFRSPHNAASIVSVIGGGMRAMPGEISLAHNGVLYLDEIMNFSPTVLDLLRQPLEDRRISISRARYKVTYPASFMLVASMNPCPCGYSGDDQVPCTCTGGMVMRYLSRISGPLMDRFDLNVRVKRVETTALVSDSPAETSRQVADRVSAARRIQEQRYRGSGIYVNAQMRPEDILRFCSLSGKDRKWLQIVMDRCRISARGYYRTLKIARTIADMAGSEDIAGEHISEAVQYRFPDNLKNK